MTDEIKSVGLTCINYNVLKLDTWICSTGTSTHMCNTDEWMGIVLYANINSLKWEVVVGPVVIPQLIK